MFTLSRGLCNFLLLLLLRIHIESTWNVHLEIIKHSFVSCVGVRRLCSEYLNIQLISISICCTFHCSHRADLGDDDESQQVAPQSVLLLSPPQSPYSLLLLIPRRNWDSRLRDSGERHRRRKWEYYSHSIHLPGIQNSHSPEQQQQQQEEQLQRRRRTSSSWVIRGSIKKEETQNNYAYRCMWSSDM